MKPIYLDYAAATPLALTVAKAMRPYEADIFANAGSLHQPGKKAKKALEQARIRLASLLGCNPDELYFTNGGTESINLGIIGFCLANKKSGNHIITSAIEHAAVLESSNYLKSLGFKITIIPVDSTGCVKMENILKQIKSTTILISLMLANNEIGTLQPVAELGKALINLNRRRKNRVTLHTDACQAGNYMTLDVHKLHVDMLSLSGCKIYGPKGIGLLYVKRGLRLQPIIHGGGQERGLRSGTENVAAIVGLTEALHQAQAKAPAESKRLTALRHYFWSEIQRIHPSAQLNGDPIKRLANNLNISFPGHEGETLLYKLDKAGIAVSTGSACSETLLEPSHVLRALGLSAKRASSSLRFSFGRDTAKKDLDFALKIIRKVTNKG